MKDKVIIFGTGSVAGQLLSIIDLNKVDILAFVNSELTGYFYDYQIIKPNEIKDFQYDYVVIASGYVHKITEILIANDVKKERIVSYIFDENITYQKAEEVLNCWINTEYRRDVALGYISDDVTIPKFMPAIMWDNNSTINWLFKDFVREQTLSLIAKRIRSQSIKGKVAELGVYKGDFTVVINRYFSDYPLYLYDSFEGFSIEDISKDSTISNKIGESCKFQDTSVDYVISRLNNQQEVVVRKGFFPDSLGDETDFCFVSVDFNLEKPVMNALELFYQRMVKGGYILVSDYYAPFYEGSRKAVDKWCEENDVQLIPVADFYGSVIIVKG